MSGRINLSNLSDSLKEHLNGLGLTEEQVNELIENALVSINEKDIEQDEVVNGLVDKVGELNGLMTEEKGDLVGAINELFQSANNGKQLIANAIGEPLSSEDTFSAMSNDINGLLSTFKTNMMNNGITVESSDRFKSLIDKIATMVEEGSGKGIQFAEGIIDNNSILLCPSESTETIDVDMNLNFIPSYVFVEAPGGIIRSDMEVSGNSSVISNLGITRLTLNTSNIHTGIKNVSAKSFSMYTEAYKNTTLWYNVYMKAYDGKPIKWYAVGVGEEDTTLRDSLASILQEEGVNVTEEDNMSSLITKVDIEFTDKENEINSRVIPAGDATAEDVVAGKTFINSTGQLVTGTAEKGYVLDCNENGYKITFVSKNATSCMQYDYWVIATDGDGNQDYNFTTTYYGKYLIRAGVRNGGSASRYACLRFMITRANGEIEYSQEIQSNDKYTPTNIEYDIYLYPGDRIDVQVKNTFVSEAITINHFIVETNLVSR